MNRITSFLILVLFLGVYGSYRNTAHSVEKADEESKKYDSPILPPLQGTVEQEVEKGIQEARKGEFRTIYPLSSRAKEALPYLKPYVTDPSSSVRKAVAIIATSAADREGALLLATLVGSKGDSSIEAALGLFVAYTPTQVSQWGGSTLKKNLIKHVKSGRVISEELFLLSAFGADREVIETLKHYRENGKDKKTMIVKINESPLVPVPFAVDVVLSELTDTVSSRTFAIDWSKSASDQILYPLHAIKFINNKSLLKNLSGMLNNKRVLRSHQSSTGSYVDVRVMDVAYKAFAKKFGLIQDRDLYPLRPISPREMDELKAITRKTLG